MGKSFRKDEVDPGTMRKGGKVYTIIVVAIFLAGAARFMGLI